jgi:hypothetical protein
LRSLAATPLLTLLPRDDLRESAKESLANSPLRRLIASVGHRDGKIASVSSSPEEKLREEVGTASAIRLAMNEVILQRVLARIAKSLSPTDLCAPLINMPWLERPRLPILITASQRFQAEDWISSGVLALVLYEAVLRDFVRWTGYPARGVTPDGIHADQTLGELLSAKDVRKVLSDAHTDMVFYVLTDPEHGMNLRNDVAHGTIHHEALSPARILLVWLFMIRLTLIRPVDEEPHVTDEADGHESEQQATTETSAEPAASVESSH